MSDTELRVGDHYARIRERVTQLASTLSPAERETPVPTCPGWRVRDVVAHLVGVVEDAVSGRLQGPPDETMTGEQVARHQTDSVESMLEEWARLSPLFEAAISDMQAWPAALDALSHEFDICHALARPAPRADPLVAVMAPMLAGRLAGHAEVVLDGEPCPSTPPAALQLRVSGFELLRVAMGRRTLAQIAALDWSADPGDAARRIHVFGPAESPIDE